MAGIPRLDLHPGLEQRDHRAVRNADRFPKVNAGTSGHVIDSPSGATRRIHRLLRRPWIHAVLLGSVLFALLPVLINGYPGVVDEGAYASQAANLSDGSWESPRPLPSLDRYGSYEPLAGSIVRGDEWIPYSRQPLYPLMLAPLYTLGGTSGLLILSVLGTWGAAIAAMGIAGRIDPRAAIPTLWLTGLGSPLFFDTYIVVGHSVAAALAGTCALALLHACGWGRGGRHDLGIHPPDLLFAPVAVVAAVLLVLVRSEGSLLVGALAVTGSLMCIRIAHRRPSVEWARLWPPLAVGLAGVLAYVWNSYWVSVIAGSEARTGGAMTRVTDPLAQAWTSLLRPWGVDNRLASAAMAMAMVCVILSAVLLRTLPRRPAVSAMVLIGGSVALVAHHLEPQAPISGLVPTSLATAFGLLLLGSRDLRLSPIKLCLGSSALTTAGILWFAYGQGGAAEWGGRFYHVLVPLLSPVAITAILRRGARLERGPRWVIFGTLAVITASTTLAAGRSLITARDLNREIVRGTIALSSATPDLSVVVAANVNPSGVSRLFWSEIRGGYPILNGGNLASFVELLPRVEQSGGNSVLLLTDTTPMNVQYVTDKVLTRMGHDTNWKVTKAGHVGKSGYVAVVVTRE